MTPRKLYRHRDASGAVLISDAPLASRSKVAWVAPDRGEFADLATKVPYHESDAAEGAREIIEQPVLAGAVPLLAAALQGAKGLARWAVRHPLKTALMAKAVSTVAKRADKDDEPGKDASSSDLDEESRIVAADAAGQGATDVQVPTGQRTRATGDVFLMDPSMVEAALRLGAIHARRKELSPLKEIFMTGDPIHTAACRAPLYYLSDSGEWGPQVEYATQALNGGLIDSIKRLARKAAPVVAKVAGVASNLGLGGPITGAISKVANKVAQWAKPSASPAESETAAAPTNSSSTIAQSAPKASEAVSLPVEGFNPAAISKALTGLPKHKKNESALELSRWKGEIVPPALYGGDEEPSFDDEEDSSLQDSDKLREAFAFIIPQGVAMAAANHVAPEDAVFAGAVTLEQAALPGSPEEGSETSAAASDEASASEANVTGDASKLVTTDASGHVSVSPEAQAAARALGKGTENADPAYQRALDALAGLAERADSGKLLPFDGIDLPQSLTDGHSLSGESIATSLTLPQSRKVIQKALKQWGAHPRRAVGPLLRAALGATALVVLLRETSSDAKRKEVERIIQALLALMPRSVDEVRSHDAAIDLQKQGSASEAQARSITDDVAIALAMVEALLLGKNFPAKKRPSPSAKLLSAYISSLISGAVTAADLKANGGMLRELVREWARNRGSAEKLAVDDADLIDSGAAQRAATDAIGEARGEIDGDEPSSDTSLTITDDDRELWQRNSGFIKKASSLLDDQRLATLLSALGFGAAIAPLIAHALKSQADGRRAAAADRSAEGTSAERRRRSPNAVLIGAESVQEV